MIGSLMSRMEDAQKLSIQQLQKSIQDGVLPAYIGIPLLQDKIKQAQSAQSPQQPQQPPIAQQVLAQAKQIESGMIPQQQMPQQPPQQLPQQSQMAQQMPQGIDSAESNLPTEMAEGGIVNFANGGVTGGGEMQLTVPISIGGEGGGGPYTAAGGGFGSGGGGYAPPGGPQGGSMGSLASLLKGAQQGKETSPLGPQAQGAQGAQMNMQENAQSAQGMSNDGLNGFSPIQTNQGTLLAGQFLQGLSGIPNQKVDNAMGAKSFGYQQMESAPQPILGMAKGGPVSYARGSIIDDEDDDIDPTEDFRTASKMFARDPMEQRREAASMLGMSDSIRPMLSSFTQPISDFASGIKSKFINKTPEVNTVVKPEVQPEGGISGIIASKAQKYNLPPQLMSSIAKAESNFNPNAGNKTGSSAKGLYQFIDKTWMGMGGKPGEQFDPEINSELGAKYIRQNAEFLKNRLGRDPSYSEVYAAHYFGPSGASNLLTRANPKDSIEKGLGTFNDPKGVKLIMKQNPNLRGKTVGQVLNDLETKTGSGIVSLAEGGQIKHFQTGGGTDYSEGYNKINWRDKEKEAKEGKKIKIPGSNIPYQYNPSQLNVGANRTPFTFTPNTPSLGIPSALPSNPSTTTPFVNPSLASMKSANPVVQSAPTVANQNPSVAMYNIKDADAKLNARPTIRGMNAGSGDTNTFPGGSDINTYLELQEVMKKNPNDENLKSGLNDLLRRNPNLPKEAAGAEKRYAEYKKTNPNSLSDRLASFLGIGGGFPNNNQSTALNTDIANQAGVSIKKPVATTSNANNKPTPLSANVQEVADKFTGPAPVANTSYLGDDTNTEVGGLMAPFTPKTDEKEVTTKVEEKSAFDKFLEGLEAKRGEIKGKKDEDKYMSLLAAGLGMMSGTSQFAAANIGKGALAGVQDYRDTQKQRAAELAAVDKEIGSGLYRKTVGDYYTANALTKDEKAKRDQLALDEKVQNNAATQYRFINEQIDNQVKSEMASLQKSLGGTIMTAEQIALKSDEIRRRLEQKNSPLINTLLKRMNMPTIDLESTPIGNRFNFNDIPNKK